MIKAKLKLLPDLPGCYLMKDKENQIIYVGKAKSLKNRVKQYFTGAHDGKTQRLVQEIRDFEYIITSSEKDSLLLEINLIKKHNPKYNIALKDGKTYPYIKLDPNANPILSTIRNPKSKNAYYFGPFPNVLDAKNTIRLLNQLYGLYESRYLIEKESSSYELKDQKGNYRAQYRVSDQVIEEIKRFLNGDTKEIENRIKKEMLVHSENLEFELAKEKYELLQSIDHVVSKNQVQLKDKSNKDIFNYYFENGYMCVQVFMIRQGKLIERQFQVFAIYRLPEEEFISFVLNYYEENEIPKEIILPINVDTTLLKEIITPIYQPQKGEKRKMLETVFENAKKQLQNHFKLNSSEDKNIQTWIKLNELLNLKIKRIEVFDNSHMASSHNVSGMIVVENGIFLKKEYRQFKLQEYISDLHSMKEVIYRRYFRLLNEDGKLPDAIFVDGGMLQVNAAVEIIESLGLTVPIFGLVKDDKHRSAGLINQLLESIEIDKKSDVFFLLTRIQDEIHRYVIQFHKNVRSKSMFKSFLDDIKGLGEARKSKLLRHFKNITHIKNASIEELSEVIPEEVAKLIYEKARKKD